MKGPLALTIPILTVLLARLPAAAAEAEILDGDVAGILSSLKTSPASAVAAVSNDAPLPPEQAAAALQEARAVVAHLATKNGFYAGNDYRQYWTRDLGYSAEILIRLGYADAVEAQLKAILARQKPSGAIPAMMQTAEGVLHDINPALLARTLRYRGRHVFDQLAEFASNFHAGEADNPLIFLVTVKTYERMTGRTTFSEGYRENLDKIVRLIDASVDGRGMIKGSGWFDAMINYNDKITLHNQVWLYKMYEAFGRQDRMRRTRAAIEDFWDPRLGFYVDALNGDRFDTLSNAMLLEEGLVPQERTQGILDMLAKVRTPYGYLNLYPAYPIGECSQYPHQYQNSTVWPFVEYRVARALKKYGMADEVRKIRDTMAAKKGANEWYSPVDGTPNGSKNQLWTACAYLGVAHLADTN